MLSQNSVSGPGVLLLLLGAVVTAGETGPDTAAVRREFVEQQIAAGEFGPALETAGQAVDAAERSELLGTIAAAQMRVGDFDAALGSIRRIPNPTARRQRHAERVEQQALNGGTGADFDTLINLIMNETEGPWEAIDGIGGTISPFETGVRVDPHGVLAHLSRREFTARLNELGKQSRQADLNEDMARPSELRMVSITRLERAAANRLLAGQ